MATIPELWPTGPRDAVWTLALAHGASQGMDTPFMSAFAAGLPARGAGLGGLRVVRFEFPYMSKARQEGRSRPPDREPVLLDAWRRVIAALAAECPRKRLLLGGQSLGGRMASLIADEQGVAGVICLGYPFHPPGKPQQLRITHLQTLRTPMLICQGTRDVFGNADEATGYRLAGAVRLVWIEDGDHSLKPRPSSGRSPMPHWEEAMNAVIDFIAALPAT